MSQRNFISDADFEKNIGIAQQPNNFISDDDFEKNIGFSEEPSSKSDYSGMAKAVGRGAAEGVYDLGRGAAQLFLKATDKGTMPVEIPGLQQALDIAKATGFIPKDLEKKFTEYAKEQKKEYQELPYIKEHPIASTVGEIGGGVLATLPFGAASLPMKGAQAAAKGAGVLSRAASAATSNPARIVGTGALQGAAVGGLEFDPTGDNRLSHLATGAAIGAAIPGGFLVGRGIYRAAKQPKGAIQIENTALADEAAKRVAEAKSIGVDKLTAGAATRDPAIQAREEILLKDTDNKAGNLLRQTYADVEKQIYNVGQRMIKKIGGEEKAAEIMGDDIQSTLRSMRSAEAKKVDSLYEQAKLAPGGDAVLPSEGIINSYQSVLNDFVDVKLSPAIKKTMENLNSENLTVDSANKLIKQLNLAGRSTNSPSDKMAINILKDKVYQSLDSIAEDSANPARELFQLARDARKKMGDVFDQKDIVDTIIKKKSAYTDYINPEQVVDKINSLTNWNKIEKSLKYDNSEAGIAAWNNLRTTKLSKFFEKSTDYVNGQPQLSFSKLTKNYKDMGDPVMKKIIGDPEVFNDFKTLLNVMDYWKNKAPGTINYSNTAHVLNRIAEKGFNVLSHVTLGMDVLAPIKKLFGMMKSADKNWVKSNLEIGSSVAPKLTRKSGINEGKVAKAVTGFLPRAASISANRPSTQEEAGLY